MSTTKTATQNLATIVHESEEAAKAAAEAQAKAMAAKAKADQAQERAEAERAKAYRAFLDQVTAEYPDKRTAALDGAGAARAELEQAVRDGDNVFPPYLRWVEASIAVWETDSELAQIRHHHGVPVRATDPPVFRFDIDISAIIDQIAGELQDDAVQRIDARRIAFVNGRTA